MSAIKENGEAGAVDDGPGSHGLRGSMGVLELIFTVVAYNGPVVVFLGFIPVSILLGNGIGTPVAMLACGLVALLIAVGLLKVVGHLKKPGGFYTLTTAGLGREVGLGAGFTGLTCYFFAEISSYALGGVALGNVVEDFLNGPDAPWWVWGLVMLAGVSVLGYFNVSFSAKVLTVFLACELALMVAYNVSVLGKGGGPQGLGLDSFSFDQISSGSLSIALLFGMGLFGGFEATVIFRDEVRDPQRTIPRATYGVIALLAGMYSLTAWTFINSYGANVIMDVLNADLGNAASASIKEYTGELAYDLARIMLFTSSLALALAAHNIASRYVFNLGADGIFPSKLGHAHRRHVSPHRASLVMSVVAAVVVAGLAVLKIDDDVAYARLAGLYSYSFLMVLVLVSLAIGVYLVRHRATAPATRTAAAAFVGFGILVVTLVLATKNFALLTGAEGTGKTGLLVLIWGITALGVVIALVAKRSRPDVYARIGRQ